VPALEEQDTTRLVRRQRVVVWVTCLATAVSLVALGLSAFVKSPAQKASEAQPPAASVITVPVRSDVLTATVVARGTVVVGSSVPVVGLASGGDASRIVTSITRKAGDEVESGDLLAQVSGRPIFLLRGRVPAFRDLTPGTSGTDVRQLQKALRALGYSYAPDRAGYLGRGTQRAVSRFYRASGFAPLTTSDLDPAQDSEIEAAGDAVTAARRALDRARTAARPLRGAELRAAKREIRYANEDLAEARARAARLRKAAGTVWPLAELVFASRMPAAVGTISAAVGTDLSASESSQIMTLNTGTPHVRAVIPQGSETGLAPGLKATITDDVRGLDLPGTVEKVGKFQAAAGGGTESESAETPAGYPVFIKGVDPLPISWLGRDVRIQIVVSKTDQPVLTVPRAALVTSPDNTTWVTVANPDGSQTPVQVRTGMIAAGDVEVVPSDPSALHVDTQVVIG
jgi:peptidoglycan hydrolase-like protein with peptidoglycan-binding domain